MILQFKEELGVEKTTNWAQQEDVEPYRPGVLVVVEAADGTLGQVFCADLCYA